MAHIMKILIDNVEVECLDGVRVIYEDQIINEDDTEGEVHVKLTSEGMIVDVIGPDGEVDHGVVRTMWQGIADLMDECRGPEIPEILPVVLVGGEESDGTEDQDEVQDITVSPATRNTYKHLTDRELVHLALQAIVEEITEYGYPQTDDNAEFGDDTAMGFARNVLQWVKLPPLHQSTSPHANLIRSIKGG